MDNIKMGSKLDNTQEQINLLNQTRTGVVINKINIDGSDGTNNISPLEQTIDYSKKEKEKEPLIQIDKKKFLRLIEICIEDLSVPRKLKINKMDRNIEFIKSYNSGYRMLEFNFSIQEINSMLGSADVDLSDFFTSFFISNVNTYVKNEFNGRPENLPIFMANVSTERKNTVIFDLD